MNYKPLYDPHGDHYTGLEKFLLGMPLINPMGHLRRSIREQISARGEDALDAWEGCGMPREFVLEISKIVAEWMQWRKPYFLPEDEARFVFWEGDEGLRTLDLGWAIEKRFRIQRQRHVESPTEPFAEFMRRLWGFEVELQARRAKGEVFEEPLTLWQRMSRRFRGAAARSS